MLCYGQNVFLQSIFWRFSFREIHLKPQWTQEYEIWINWGEGRNRTSFHCFHCSPSSTWRGATSTREVQSAAAPFTTEMFSCDLCHLCSRHKAKAPPAHQKQEQQQPTLQPAPHIFDVTLRWRRHVQHWSVKLCISLEPDMHKIWI